MALGGIWLLRSLVLTSNVQASSDFELDERNSSTSAATCEVGEVRRISTPVDRVLARRVYLWRSQKHKLTAALGGCLAEKFSVGCAGDRPQGRDQRPSAGWQLPKLTCCTRGCQISAWAAAPVCHPSDAALGSDRQH